MSVRISRENILVWGYDNNVCMDLSVWDLVVTFVLYIQSRHVIHLIVGYGIEFVFSGSIVGILIILTIASAIV